jgi:hypothetical protein
VQLLLGAAGVAINSAPTEGVPALPLSQIKSTFPVLKNPANRSSKRTQRATVPVRCRA